jgi:DMSO/TMAO reductase YedYZ molybdopterin-dependent catalytic subunit
MSKLSRRKLITTGLFATAGASGLAAAARLANSYGLIPPNHGGIYGLGETLTYASHRLLTRNSRAREFPRSQISKTPFAQGEPPESEEFLRPQASGFTDWQLSVDGLVAHPRSFSVAEIKNLPTNSQITQLICEEGWSFIAEWIGTPLSHVLDIVGILPQARYVVYTSIQPGWWHSIDMADALHPQTLLTYGMNDVELPVGHGGPLRLRIPRQLGYKSVKYLTRLTLTDRLSVPSAEGSEGKYSWYAGI